ncbi:hypothetical protein HELRODRAFT_192918 [Helobdella robusta]|uniref:Protein quiver n=1 Tax=Helobdella robusta TaxID=6412 RepID=T1FUF5_HELRO|nr:hypothetical protein HELRODRAFT_192918 [Helobdella robusta]ESN98436.1 hypothetical protein HELRODRAFT_192918 [Helobdella robusta]
MKAYLILLTAIFAFFLQPGSAIKCYMCNVTASCNDPFSATGNGQCDGTYCFKSSASASGIQAVYRGCASANWTAQIDGCTDLSSLTPGVKTIVCYCSTGLCNGSEGFKFTPFFLIGISTIGYLARYALI